MCVPGEMHTKRQMHSAQSIKMQMSFIRGGNICVGRESVFRLSVGPIHPCGIWARMYTRHPGSGSCGRLRWDELTLEGDATESTALSFGQIFILRPIRRINGNREDRVRITIFRMERNRS